MHAATGIRVLIDSRISYNKVENLILILVISIIGAKWCYDLYLRYQVEMDGAFHNYQYYYIYNFHLINIIHPEKTYI
ncbi:MAG: hypothetical protein ACEY3J_00995 [Arsenophonus sp.]